MVKIFETPSEILTFPSPLGQCWFVACVSPPQLPTLTEGCGEGLYDQDITFFMFYVRRFNIFLPRLSEFWAKIVYIVRLYQSLPVDFLFIQVHF